MDNNKRSFTQDLKALMNAYNTAKLKYVEINGSDDGFDYWFKKQMNGGR